MVRHDVVEGMVATLQRLLVGETGLLEQVDDHIGSGQLSLLKEEWKSKSRTVSEVVKTYRVEVDSDELSES